VINMEKKSTYYLPVTLVELVKTKPESTLCLLLQLYEKTYPDVMFVEEYYKEIQAYLSNVEFRLSIPESHLPEEIN